MNCHVGDIVTFNKYKCWREDRPTFDCEIVERSPNDNVSVWRLLPVEVLPCPIDQILTTKNHDGTFWCHVDYFRASEVKPIAVDATDLL